MRSRTSPTSRTTTRTSRSATTTAASRFTHARDRRTVGERLHLRGEDRPDPVELNRPSHGRGHDLPIPRLPAGALGTPAPLGRRSREALHSAFVGTTSLALQFGCVYFAAARGVNLGLIALVSGMMPIVTALMGLVLGDPVRALQWVGFACAASPASPSRARRVSASAPAPDSAPISVLLSLLALSAGTLYQKRHASSVDLRGGLALKQPRTVLQACGIAPAALGVYLATRPEPALSAPLAAAPRSCPAPGE